MYLVLFLDQNNYEFITSLHRSGPAAEAAVEGLLRRFIVGDGELPPKATWAGLCDSCGKSVHLFEIELGGKPAEEISHSLSGCEDLTAT